MASPDHHDAAERGEALAGDEGDLSNPERLLTESHEMQPMLPESAPAEAVEAAPPPKLYDGWAGLAKFQAQDSQYEMFYTHDEEISYVAQLLSVQTSRGFEKMKNFEKMLQAENRGPGSGLLPTATDKNSRRFQKLLNKQITCIKDMLTIQHLAHVTRKHSMPRMGSIHTLMGMASKCFPDGCPIVSVFDPERYRKLEKSRPLLVEMATDWMRKHENNRFYGIMRPQKTEQIGANERLEFYGEALLYAINGIIQLSIIAVFFLVPAFLPLVVPPTQTATRLWICLGLLAAFIIKTELTGRREGVENNFIVAAYASAIGAYITVSIAVSAPYS